MDFGVIPKVDEDEGSPLRNGVNSLGSFDTALHKTQWVQVYAAIAATQPPREKNRTISGSLPGTPYPILFPSKENFADNTA